MADQPVSALAIRLPNGQRRTVSVEPTRFNQWLVWEGLASGFDQRLVVAYFVRLSGWNDAEEKTPRTVSVYLSEPIEPHQIESMAREFASRMGFAYP